MGSFENSVIVDEPRSVSISGQHLCSEISRPFVDSKMDLACAPDRCPESDLVCDHDSGCLSYGETTQTCTVNGDGSVAEHKDVDVLGLENSLRDDSGFGGVCLDESRSGIDVREAESSGECLQEGTFLSEHEIGDVLPSENSLENDSGHGGSCLGENANDIAVREKKSRGVCLLEGTFVSRDGSGGEDETVDVLGLDSLMKNGSTENHSDVDVNEKEGGGQCISLQEGSCVSRYGFVGNYEAVDVLLLENLLKDDSRHSGGSLDVNHDDVDVREKESNGECLQEGTSVSSDVAGGEYEARDVSGLDNLLKNDSAVSGGHLDENHGDVDILAKESGGECLREDSSVRRDGLVSENEAVDILLLENLSKKASQLSGGCLDENHNDFGVIEKESSRECLQEGSYGDFTHMCTVNGDGLVGEHKNLDVLASENLLKNDSGITGGCSDENQSDIDACNAESCGECLQEGVSGGEDDLRNPLMGSEIHSEITTVSDLPINCICPDEQKDEKVFCCLFPEDIIEVREDKVDLCEQEPPSQDCENLKLAPEYDVLGNTLEKGQNFESVGHTSLGNISGKDVVAVGLGADICNGISDPLERGEVSLEVSHSGEEVSNYNCKKDQNNCSGLFVEKVTKAVGMESDIDTSNQVLLSTSLESVHKLGSARTCVQQDKQMDEKCDGSPSTLGVTEFVEEKNESTVDAKVEVGAQIMALEDNSCTDISGSLNSRQPFAVVDDDSSKKLDVVADQLDNSSHGPIRSISTVGCSGQTGDQGNDNVGVNCVSEAKCSDITPSSRQRNSRRSRSNHKAQAKKAMRKCKKTAEALCPNGIVNITFKAKKKRSSLLKSARSSVWGLLGNVTQLFEHSNGLELIQVPNQASQTPKGGKKSGKQKKNGANTRSQSSKKKSSDSNTKIRLKVKLGKGVNQTILNVMVPKVVDNLAISSAISCDYGTELCKVSPKVANGEVDDCQKGEVSMHFQCLNSNEEKVKSCPDASVQDAQVVSNDLDANIVGEKSTEDVGDDCFGIFPNVLVEASGEVTESRCKDPGTSPDSEVINLIPDAHVDPRPPDDFHATVTSPKDLDVPGDLTSGKRGKKKNKVSGLVNSNTEDNSPLPVRRNKAKPLKQYGRKQNSNNGICPGEDLIFSISAKASSNSSSDKEPSIVEPLLSSVETAPGVSREALKVETGVEAEIHCKLDNGIVLSKSQKSKNFLSPKTKGRKLPKGKSQGSDSEIKRVNSHSKRETQRSSVGKKANKKPVCDRVACKVESHPEAENHMLDDKAKANSGENISATDISNLDVPPAVLGEQYLPPRNAWVRCDSCHKWRRILAELADYIEENQCSWTCKDNVDKAFADCSTRQEKSNADINAELEISDASGEDDASGTRLNYKGLECRRPRDLRETPTCISIRTNQFLHRSRKTQTIDEIMVCHCKPPPDGQLGCGDDCLNRMLNIECVQSACPCGDLCSNQQFQKRKYAKLGKFQCGKKGYGLKLLQDISKGKFLIEYVGEVLDMPAYEARQKGYALKGHKHFYFMTLNGSEVIDACIKGNKGRFINHSCEPNCRTEKWMVNGEICIGLFALRDIKKGEEVTFDYNYVRVFGAAAKKCYCGSAQCRGYLGGDPLNGDVVIQSDSDEDYSEPMMLPENGDAKKVRKPCSGVIKKISESTLDHVNEKDKQTPALVQSDISTGKEDSMSHSVSPVSHVHDALELDRRETVQPFEISQQSEDVSSELISPVQPENSMGEETMEKSPSSSEMLELTPPVKVLSKSSSDGVDSKRKSKSDTVDGQLSSKAHPKVKTSRSSSSVRKEKIKSPSTSKVQASKSQVLHIKPKKVIEGSFGNSFEAVEEKLNELLDADGGISKRKDAAKGYLKLLLLTAVSGGSANGEAIQRNRDLSMILDALLKTKSRVVLIDIINKNGLRMLHNIMKQYRRDFKKIPILRKLLKVLEYLAAREILTSEHINGGPPCRGMESFKESILSLTEHEDRQVHQIARNFRDRWIPRNLRKFGFADRDDNKTEFPRSSNYNRYHAKQNNWSDHHGRPAEANDCVEQSTPARDAGIREGPSASAVGVSPTSGTKTRKRKSRWDQPAETNSDFISLQHKEQRIEYKAFESTVDHRDKLNREENNSPGSANDCCQLDKGSMAHDERETVLEDVPPGFSSPLKPPPGSSVAASMVFHSKFDTVIGHPQEKFISRLPVSYGIPLSIMQQFGTPHAETAGSWVIAPGMPFRPFPPLPPYPRGKKDPSTSDDINRMSVNQPAEEAQPDSRLPATSNSNDCTPSTTGDQPRAEVPCTNNHYTSKRGRESSYDLTRRYFKQQKWNNTKLGPSCHWRRNRWGCMGNSRDGTSSVSIGDVTNEHRSTYCSEDLSCTVEKVGNYSSQHPDHHSQH